jgi:hypothetical protein
LKSTTGWLGKGYVIVSESGGVFFRRDNYESNFDISKRPDKEGGSGVVGEEIYKLPKNYFDEAYEATLIKEFILGVCSYD